MSVPAPSDLEIYQGDTFEYFFRVKNTDTGIYLDLTGFTVNAEIRATADSTPELAVFTTVISDQVAVRGGCLLSLSPVQTAALSSTGGVWDCELIDPAGKVTTILAGAVTVIEQVTR